MYMEITLCKQASVWKLQYANTNTCSNDFVCKQYMEIAVCKQYMEMTVCREYMEMTACVSSIWKWQYVSGIWK